MDLILVGLCTSFLGTDDWMVCSQVLVGQRVAADLILKDLFDFYGFIIDWFVQELEYARTWLPI